MLSVAARPLVPYDTITGKVPVDVPPTTVHVSGEKPPFVHEIEPARGVDVCVQVDAVVRSYTVPLEVPWEINVSVAPPALELTVQMSGVLPLEQEVVAPKLPIQTWKLLTLPRKTVSVAVELTLWEPAVMLDVPDETP
jgi:hypothetical protein